MSLNPYISLTGRASTTLGRDKQKRLSLSLISYLYPIDHYDISRVNLSSSQIFKNSEVNFDKSTVSTRVIGSVISTRKDYENKDIDNYNMILDFDLSVSYTGITNLLYEKNDVDNYSMGVDFNLLVSKVTIQKIQYDNYSTDNYNMEIDFNLLITRS